MPLAPDTSAVVGVLADVEDAFRAYRLDPSFVRAEPAQMTDDRLAATASRSVVGVMYTLTHLRAL